MYEFVLPRCFFSVIVDLYIVYFTVKLEKDLL